MESLRVNGTVFREPQQDVEAGKGSFSDKILYTSVASCNSKAHTHDLVESSYQLHEVRWASVVNPT